MSEPVAEERTVTVPALLSEIHRSRPSNEIPVGPAPAASSTDSTAIGVASSTVTVLSPLFVTQMCPTRRTRRPLGSEPTA